MLKPLNWKFAPLSEPLAPQLPPSAPRLTSAEPLNSGAMLGDAEALGLVKVIVAVPVWPTPSVLVEKLTVTPIAPAAPTVTLCWAWGAAFQLESPAWLALIRQVP